MQHVRVNVTDVERNRPYSWRIHIEVHVPLCWRHAIFPSRNTLALEVDISIKRLFEARLACDLGSYCTEHDHSSYAWTRASDLEKVGKDCSPIFYFSIVHCPNTKIGQFSSCLAMSLLQCTRTTTCCISVLQASSIHTNVTIPICLDTEEEDQDGLLHSSL